MQVFLKALITTLLLLFVIPVYAGAEAASPAGYWQTIDDVTHQPKSILEISETTNKVLTARVVKIYPRPGYDQNEICTECKGVRHNQPIVGMVVMERLKQSAKNKNQWINGEILDPINGKTYRCNLVLLENGNQANIRGYIGLPLFGRSQTWLRVKSI